MNANFKLFAVIIFFFKIRKIFQDEMLVRSKNFPRLIEKIEEIKPSLSKQFNKIRSEMLKIKKRQNNEARENFRDPGNFCENFPFPGKFKIRETLSLSLSTAYSEFLP